MKRLLGIQIANGFSPEARVFAGLLQHGGQEAGQAHVLFHEWQGDRESAARFRQTSGASVYPLDFGWRSIAAGRTLAERIGGRLRFLATFPRALQLARKIDPDVIYSCQQLWDCQLATFLSRMLNRPQIIHLHYIIGPWLHRPILERLRTCDHVLTVSDFIRSEALRHGVPTERVTALRNTISLPPLPECRPDTTVREELGLAPNTPVLGIVARLDPEKGQADTLQAFARVVKSCPAARLLVVGSETPWHPGYAEHLRELSNSLGLDGKALFLGRRSDVPRLLNALDVFLHPTRLDPCPLAILEAAAAGLPVVAYAEGGASELVRDGVTGLLAPSGSVVGLAERIEHLLAHPDTSLAMGAAGRRYMAEHFYPEKAGRAFASFISSSLYRRSVTA